jgi:hypothetical protein
LPFRGAARRSSWMRCGVPRRGVTCQRWVCRWSPSRPFRDLVRQRVVSETVQIDRRLNRRDDLLVPHRGHHHVGEVRRHGRRKEVTRGMGVRPLAEVDSIELRQPRWATSPRSPELFAPNVKIRPSVAGTHPRAHSVASSRNSPSARSGGVKST